MAFESPHAPQGVHAPRYVSVAHVLAGQIMSGQLTDRLEPERSLSERFGVSRVTIRRALGLLAEEGLLTPAWGSGWFVADRPLSEPPNTLVNFTELAERRGLKATSRLIRQQERSADMDEAARLQIVPGEKIFVLERVRLLDGVPTLLQLSHLPLSRLPGLAGRDLSESSLYRTLEHFCGVVPVRADFAVEARSSTEEIAGLLEIEPGSPLLWTTQTSYGRDGQIVEWGWGAYPHDRYRFRATLTSTRSPQVASPGGLPASQYESTSPLRAYHS